MSKKTNDTSSDNIPFLGTIKLPVMAIFCHLEVRRHIDNSMNAVIDNKIAYHYTVEQLASKTGVSADLLSEETDSNPLVILEKEGFIERVENTIDGETSKYFIVDHAKAHKATDEYTDYILNHKTIES